MNQNPFGKISIFKKHIRPMDSGVSRKHLESVAPITDYPVESSPA